MILYSDYMAEIPSGTVTTEKQREEKIIEMKTLTMTGINAPALMVLWSLILTMQKGSNLHGCTYLHVVPALVSIPPLFQQ